MPDDSCQNIIKYLPTPLNEWHLSFIPDLCKYGSWWPFTADNHCVDAGVEYCSIEYLLILPKK